MGTGRIALGFGFQHLIFVLMQECAWARNRTHILEQYCDILELHRVM
jgi:hypothetical protein